MEGSRGKDGEGGEKIGQRKAEQQGGERRGEWRR